MKKSLLKFVTSTLVGASIFASMPITGVFADEQTSYYSYKSNADYEVETQITASWDKHANVEFTFKNVGDSTIDNWYFTFEFPYTIENIWNASVVDSNGEGVYTIGNAVWNQDIAAGSSITFGMTISGEDDDFSDIPTAYILNTKDKTIDSSDYSLSYAEQSEWEEGFTGAMYLTPSTELTDWSLTIETNREITDVFAVPYQVNEDGTYTITNDGNSNNQNIAAGTEYYIGIQGINTEEDFEILNSSVTVVTLAYGLDEDLNGNGIKDYLEELGLSDLSEKTETPAEPTVTPEVTEPVEPTVTPEVTEPVEPSVTPEITEPTFDDDKINVWTKEDCFSVKSTWEYIPVYVYVPTSESASVVAHLENSVAYLKDDGKYDLDADDIGGDQTYTNFICIDRSKVGTFELNVEVTVDGITYTKSTVVSVINPTSIMECMTSINAAVNEYRNSDEFANANITERINKTYEILVSLQEQGYVKDNSISISEGSGIIKCYTKDGIKLSFILKDEDPTKHGVGGNSYADGNSLVGLDYAPTPVVSSAEAYMLYCFDDAVHADHLQDVLIPFYDDEDLNVTINDNVSYSDFTTCLSAGYDVVVISAHGIYDTDEREPWINSGIKFSADSADSEVALYYQESANDYVSLVGDPEDSSLVDVYIRPGFFEAYYPTGSYNSVVIVETCESLGANNDPNFLLADTLRNCGFPYVVGFYNEVNCGYAHHFTRLFIKEFFAGNSTSTSFSNVTSEIGTTDREYQSPYNSDWMNDFNSDDSAVGTPYGIGIQDFYVSSGEILNPNFDLNTNSDNFYGWNTSGDARIVQSLGSQTPTNGSSMALISTGIGSTDISYLTSNEGSTISQSFVVPSDAEVLKFDYHMLSEEPMEWVGRGYNDTFNVYLVVDGSRNLVFTLSIDTANWIRLNGMDFAGGDNTLYQTGWFVAEVDVSEYAGEEVELEFVVTDVGDSIYDTVVLIDNVRFD